MVAVVCICYKAKLQLVYIEHMWIPGVLRYRLPTGALLSSHTYTWVIKYETFLIEKGAKGALFETKLVFYCCPGLTCTAAHI